MIILDRKYWHQSMDAHDPDEARALEVLLKLGKMRFYDFGNGKGG